MDNNYSDKRCERRIPVGIPASLSIADPVKNTFSEPTTVYIKDISSRGAKISIDDTISSQVDVDYKLSIAINFTQDTKESIFNAKVKWLRNETANSMLIGVEYFDISEKSQKYLDYFISGPIAGALNVDNRKSGRHIKKRKKTNKKIAFWIFLAILGGVAATFLLIFTLDYLAAQKKDARRKKKDTGVVETLVIDTIKNADVGKETMEELKKKYEEYKNK